MQKAISIILFLCCVHVDIVKTQKGMYFKPTGRSTLNRSVARQFLFTLLAFNSCLLICNLRSASNRPFVRGASTSLGQSDSIMVVATVKERVGYVRLLAATLEWLRVYEFSPVWLFVDETAAFGISDVRAILPRAIVSKVVHEFLPRTSPDMSTRVAFEKFYESDYDILVNIDSDTALHPAWREFILAHINQSYGVLSLYNSAAHPMRSCSNGLCVKDTVGAMGVVMTRQMVGKILQNVPRRLKAFDWGFVDFFRSNGITALVPQNSLALHYGMHGSNGNGSHIEHAVGFDESVFPDAIRQRIEFFLQGGRP